MKLAPRRVVLALAAAPAAAVLVLAGGVLADPRSGSAAGAPEQIRGAAAPGSIEALQEHLRRVPGDHPGWAALGRLYVDRARLTADPSFYAKAQAALDRSLEVSPTDNASALTGLATLQAAQHDFGGAEASARRALAVNAFDAGAYAVLADALTELGRYDEAVTALQEMADLRPGFPALARISYARELRGDVAGARAAMQQALEAAGNEDDAAFALLHLGELALEYGGDVAAASGFVEQGLRRSPDSLPLQAARARLDAAAGRTDVALRAYEQVNARVPVQAGLVEHAELLAAQGRQADADAQLAVVRASNELLKANGSVVDLEEALFEADHGDPQRALEVARAAHAARPDNVFTNDALAWALHASGRSAEALPHADRALALGLRRASFLYHRGEIARALDRDAAARRDLAAALELNPHFSVLGAATARRSLAGG